MLTIAQQWFLYKRYDMNPPNAPATHGKTIRASKRFVLSVTVDSWMLAGASTVAGVEATLVAGATLFAGEVGGLVAGLCCATEVVVVVVVAGGTTLFAGEVAGLCCVTALEVAGPVAGLVAGCAVFSGSRGSGARVSDGKAFDAFGVSTLGEFVVVGAGAFSFFARSAVEAGGDCAAFDVVASMPLTFDGDFCGAVLFNAIAGFGIGLGSMDGALSTLATSFGGVTGAAATFCCNQPRS